MSKIFINHTFKCVSITTFSSSPDEIIDTLCSDIDNVSIQRILNQISRTIINNKFYVGLSNDLARTKSGGGLLPTNSRLYSNGSNTSDVPDIERVRNLLEVKLKIDDIENEFDEFDDEKLFTGHFRFHLPPVIPPQLIILMKCPTFQDKLLLFYHGNSKFLPIFTSNIQNTFDCTISDIVIGNEMMQECISWAINNDVLDCTGGLELWFGKLQTSGNLGSIIIRIEDKDIKIIHDSLKVQNDENQFAEVLYEYLQSQTSISFKQLHLVKLKCQLFTLYMDGKVKFTSFMSHLGHKQKSKHGDQRLSIWWIIRYLSEL
jgi:hypothetical protein